ncbi:helix-turn-helix transcriptional regulator [Enterococcus hulanensis]|uniref:AraC family transcriptional regulator n=1 Tax=Enterococcus hulanensis TaxID=2559929 RepID=UPI001A90D3A8|nr:AraC family transcriptional regulator [Enterococcus hulanensis]MBO0410161.1 helix-turn-helix transcriptional regulator [Enterococcus hulanensis]
MFEKDLNLFRENDRILLKAKEFLCLSPSLHLRKYISNYNITFPVKELIPSGFTAMPSGCATLEVVMINNKIFTHIEGPTTIPSFADNIDQVSLMVTIEFKPAGFYVFTGLNQNEILDDLYALETINSDFDKSISELIEQAKNIQELINKLDVLFLKALEATYQPEITHILKKINESAGTITVKQLSDDIHYSERHVNRLFKQYVGTSVKSFSKIVRINKAFQLLKRPKNSLNIVSDTLSYHDLSHFNNEFKQICGITPQTYRKNMSDFYNNPIKF